MTHVIWMIEAITIICIEQRSLQKIRVIMKIATNHMEITDDRGDQDNQNLFQNSLFFPNSLIVK